MEMICFQKDNTVFALSEPVADHRDHVAAFVEITEDRGKSRLHARLVQIDAPHALPAKIGAPPALPTEMKRRLKNSVWCNLPAEMTEVHEDAAVPLVGVVRGREDMADSAEVKGDYGRSDYHISLMQIGGLRTLLTRIDARHVLLAKIGAPHAPSAEMKELRSIASQDLIV